MSDQKAPVNNSPFTSEELEHFKSALLDEQKKADEQIQELEQSLEDLERNLSDNTSSSAHHQGNLGSNEEQRETKYTLIEKQKAKLEKITVALDRMAAGNYGICVVTGNQIQNERLEAMPWAIHSIDAMQSDSNQEEKTPLHVEETSN